MNPNSQNDEPLWRFTVCPDGNSVISSQVSKEELEQLKDDSFKRRIQYAGTPEGVKEMPFPSNKLDPPLKTEDTLIISDTINTMDDTNLHFTKHEIYQATFSVFGTAIAVAALVVPLIQWGMDAKIDSIKTEVSAVRQAVEEADKRAELRQVEFEKQMTQRQELYEKYLEAKTSNKNQNP